MPAEQTTVIEGRLPEEAAAWNTSSLLYLPFDVPPGATRIHIRRDITPLVRQKVALLLYDPRGHGPGGPGFRGYQGAVNIDAELTITGDTATCTTWYQPGPLQPGRWHIGQWYVAPTDGGLDYQYTITVGFDGPPPPDDFPPVPAYRPGVVRPDSGWYAGSLHCHTVYSYDTHISGTPRTALELIDRHADAGYDFVCITDHNSARAHHDLAAIAESHPDMLLLFGNELTTLNGHANTLGIAPGARFDFRLVPGDGRIPAIIADAHAQDALFVVNHPFQNCPDCAWRYPDHEWENADAIEVWNREWSETNRMAVDWWDKMLKAGRRIPAVGGSDYHRGDSPLSPATWVYAADLSRESVLKAVREGRSFLTDGARGPGICLTANDGPALPGDARQWTAALPVSIRVVNGGGTSLRLIHHAGEDCFAVDGDDVTLSHSVPPGRNAYVRAELTRPNGDMAAMTNPIFAA
jgi:predicted metal-dependent phosphoesterase TrpH